MVAYKMNEAKPIDCGGRFSTTWLCLTAVSMTRRSTPLPLFGRKEGIVRTFAEQAGNPKKGDSFGILISNGSGDLATSGHDREKSARASGRGGIRPRRVQECGSESNRDNQLVFLNRVVNGRIPLGWMMAILAGFRANVVWESTKGTFTWTVPIEELLDSCIEQLVLGIRDVHEQGEQPPRVCGAELNLLANEVTTHCLPGYPRMDS